MPDHDMLRVVAHHHGPRILAELERTPAGLTDFELSDRLGIYLSSVNCARNALMRRGLVAPTDNRRPSGRGGLAIVWIASPRKEAR